MRLFPGYEIEVRPVTQASYELGVLENIRRKEEDDPWSAFPSHGQLTSEQEGVGQLQRNMAKFKAERDTEE